MFKFITKLITHHPIKTMMITLLVIIISISGALEVNLKTGNDTLVQTDTDVYQDNDAYENQFGGETIVVLLDTYHQEKAFSVTNMQLLQSLETELTFADGVYTMMSPITLLKQLSQKQNEMYLSGLLQVSLGLKTIGNELSTLSGQNPQDLENMSHEINTLSQELTLIDGAINTDELDQISSDLTELTPNPNMSIALGEMSSKLIQLSQQLYTLTTYSNTSASSIPMNEQVLDQMIYLEDGTLRPLFKEFIIQDRYLMFTIKLNGSIEDDTKNNIIDSIENFISENEQEDTMLVSGKPVLDRGIKTSMKESMQSMMGLSIVIMILVLFFTFNIRWKLLPLLTIMVAVVATIGLMGWLNIPITMVSMAVFPILIGLGIDYSIQFQSRYSEELEEVLKNE